MYRETGELGALEYRPECTFPAYRDAFFTLFNRYDGNPPLSEMNEYADTFGYERRSFMGLMLAMEQAWTCDLQEEADDE